MIMTDLVGSTIGNYRIDAVLGRGGMGQVYRGVHRHLQRAAAVKVMHTHLAADTSFRARFIQEAQAAAALRHPNIVQVYEFGDEDGLLYLVMELVPGGSVRDLVEHHAGAGRPFPWPLALALARQAAEGLAYAHGRGMVHRDIKPDNLLLEREDGPPVKPGPFGAAGYTVKICDLGLARLAEGGVWTRTGAAMGTPAYMAPEQCQGMAVDGRSDVYALGVVLYRLVAGQLPFEARTPSEALFQHVYAAPPPPRQVRPELPASIEAIILRCLAKRPDDRYATAAELAAALEAAQRPGTTAAGAAGPTVLQPTTAAGPPTAATLGAVPSLPQTGVAAPAAAFPARGGVAAGVPRKPSVLPSVLPWPAVLASAAVLLAALALAVPPLARARFGEAAGRTHQPAPPQPAATALPAIPIQTPMAEPTRVPAAEPTPAPMEIREFTIDKGAILAGQPVILRWRVVNADEVEVRPIGLAAVEGESRQTPQQTTTYTLLATQAGRSEERSVEVTVLPPPTALPAAVPTAVPTAVPAAAPAAAPPVPPAAPAVSDETDIRRALEAQVRYLNAGDVDGYMTTIASQGPDRLLAETTMRQLAAAYTLRYALEDVRVLNAAGGRALVRVVQTTRAIGPQPAPFQDIRLTAEHTMVKESTGWKVLSTVVANLEPL